MNSEYIVSSSARVLVTGSNGFIGTRLVRILLENGFSNLICFVRPSSRLARLQEVLERFPAGKNVSLRAGDLLSREDCLKAAEDVALIFHLAAGMDKSFAGAFMNSALATRNLLDAFLEVGRPKRFVNVSSFAVYSTLSLERGALVDEDCALEDASQARFDAYGFGKLKQEEMVREYGERRGLPYVILRPGAVFGPGKGDLSGRVGIDTFGFFLQPGGANLLPLTYVDNCAEAIFLAGVRPGVDGETFNVVDDELITAREFLRAYAKRTKTRFVRIPYSIAYGLSVAWEKYSTWSKGQLPPAFNRRRCTAEWKPMRYSNRKLRERLGWAPRVGLNQAMDSFLEQF